MINILSIFSFLCHLWFQKPVRIKHTHLFAKTNHWIEVQKRHKDYYDDCTFTNKYSVQQRLKRYPFVKAFKIIAVSYHAEGSEEPSIYIDNNEKKVSLDSSKAKSLAGLHVKNGRINTGTLAEFVALDQQQINSLTNIIYNTDYRIKDEIAGYSEGACFEPRNALIFLDKNEKVFDYIEICFECRHAASLSHKLNIGTPCTQKYDILKKYFIDLGIKTGTLQH